MLSFLFFIFLLVLFFVFFGVSLVRGVLGALFGKRPNQYNSQTYQQQTKNNNQSSQQKQSNQKKIIDADEGEYIEYEEIKD